MGFALSDIKLSSPVFDQGWMIPGRHTGEGMDVSPALEWSDAPEGTAAYAIICHDPDAPLVTGLGTYGFVHWVLYNIPADVNQLDEGTDQYTSGRNDFGVNGYGGPMPPIGHGKHHYYFWILALDKDLALGERLTMWDLLKQIEPNLIGMNRLVGIYERD
jgi:Raf kinase inhibitor-like YbhB/YbcL family protein